MSTSFTRQTDEFASEFHEFVCPSFSMQQYRIRLSVGTLITGERSNLEIESFPPRRAGPPRRIYARQGRLVIFGHGHGRHDDMMWQRTWWQQVAAMAMASARWSPFVKHDHGKREDFDAVFFGGNVHQYRRHRRRIQISLEIRMLWRRRRLRSVVGH